MSKERHKLHMMKKKKLNPLGKLKKHAKEQLSPNKIMVKKVFSKLSKNIQPKESQWEWENKRMKLYKQKIRGIQ